LNYFGSKPTVITPNFMTISCFKFDDQISACKIPCIEPKFCSPHCFLLLYLAVGAEFVERFFDHHAVLDVAAVFGLVELGLHCFIGVLALEEH
jgi:hypothetical protein